ncbi:alanine/glycine:cation symporter family protein [Corynebacterium pyruviciproducens]
MNIIEGFNSMMSVLEDAVGTFNGHLWSFLPIPLLLAGIYFGIRTFIVQIRKIPDMFRAVVEKPAEQNDEDISAFKAFTISAASRVGTGNVAGVAIAITTGGPGAVFWMWVVAIVGGATSFVESTLAQLWKTHDQDSYRGGPAYYMTRGLNSKVLATIFAVAISFTFGFVYNALQSNAVVEAIAKSVETIGSPMDEHTTFLVRLGIGVIMAILAALVIFGGVQRIANFTQMIVPFMAVAYLILGFIIVALNFREVPSMIADIFGAAFGFRQIGGATMGMAFMYGMQRGLFSNEAGEGSAPNAAATATVSHPVKQGLVQTLGVYFDTLLVCSITAFIILLSDYHNADSGQTSSLTQDAVAASVGNWGIHFVTLVLFCLAFSSLIGNYYLAQANVQYLTNSKVVLNVFRCAVLVFVVFGSVGTVPLIWALGDTFAGTMVIINLIAIVPLGGVAIKLLRNYSEQRSQGLDPIFHRDMLPEIKNVECWDGRDSATKNYPVAFEALGLPVPQAADQQPPADNAGTK